MDKSLLILSASLLTILANAEEPASVTSSDVEMNMRETSKLVSASDEKEKSHIHLVKARVRNAEQTAPNDVTAQAQETPQAQSPSKSPSQSANAQVKAPADNLATDMPSLKASAIVDEKNASLAQTNSPAENPRSIAQEKRIRDLEMKVDQLQKQSQNEYNPFCSHPKQSFYIMGEWLYWKFTEGGTDYAITHGETTGIVPDPALPTAKANTLHFNWKSGFRVGTGYHFMDKGWDLFASYSQISANAHGSTSGSLYPLLSYQGANTNIQVSNAAAMWNIKFKVIDFEIGRQFNIAPSLTIRPQFGVKAAMINQGSHVNYTNNNVLFLPGLGIGDTDTVLEKNDFRGIGLRTGINTTWEMGAGFGFYGSGAASLLVSRIKTHQTQNQFLELVGLDTSTLVTNIDMKSKFFPLLPVVEIQFGLEWGQTFCDDTLRIGFNVGVEGQYWWKQNYLEHFTATNSDAPVYVRPTEDLSLYGLTLGGRIDF